MNNLDELIPTRQSLLSRLKDWNDQESWRDFFDTYWKLIYGAALKAGLTDAEAQDVVQETVLSVLKKMSEFQYDAEKGSFNNWLLRLTSWRITDQYRKRQKAISHDTSDDDGPPSTSTIERIADPVSLQLEATWEEDWKKNLVDAAIERVKKKIDPKQFQIYDLHVVKKWSVSKVAQTLKVNTARV